MRPRYESPYDPSSMPKDLEHVIYGTKGHVAYVTINRQAQAALGKKYGWQKWLLDLGARLTGRIRGRAWIAIDVVALDAHQQVGWGSV